MNDQIKQHCAKCDCMVRWEGHEERCRVKSVGGWTDQRKASFYGDTVQKLDVQLAMRFLAIPCDLWGETMVLYTSNLAMATYMRTVINGDQRSNHSLGTLFEASYFGDFRVNYLRAVFPTVCDNVLASWKPPSYDDCVYISK